MLKYRIVPTDPKTGKLIRSPKTYQQVRFALQGPKGGLKKIADAPIQSYTKTDHQGMNKTVSGDRNYIIYEQLTRRHMRKVVKGKIVKVQKVDKDGKLVFRRTKSGKLAPDYYQEKKFTFFRKKFRQRPVLYSGTKRQRELEIGFKKLSPRQQADQKIMTMVKPDIGKSLTYNVEGESVRDALSNLMVNIDKREIYGPEGQKHAGLYYNIVTRVITPEGSTIRIPASGALATLEKFQDIFPDLLTYQDMPGALPAFRKEVRTLANLNRELSFTISNSLTRVGYRFTKTKKLKEYAGQMTKNARRLKKEATALRKEGKKKAADKKQRSVDRVLKARETMLNDKLGKKYLNPKKYKVIIDIQFETIPVQ